MKTIICPSDLSSTAHNAIAYAAQLAALLKTELLLLNIQLVSPTHPIASGVSVLESTPAVRELLEKICEEVRQQYQISCRYTVETSAQSLEKAIREETGDDSLIVMGTNGVDDPYQYVFGTNAYHVARKVKCPVLMIPDGVSFKPIRSILFPWDYSSPNMSGFENLKALTASFDPGITLLHVSERPTEVSDEVYRVRKEEIKEAYDEGKNISFDRIFSEDQENIPVKIDAYMTDSGADLLAIALYDRGPLRNLFHGTVTKTITESASYPVLFLHS